MDKVSQNQVTECEQVSIALSEHFDGTANEAQRQLAKAHLAHCSACAEMWQGWEELRLMEQRALEPLARQGGIFAASQRIPLAPVIVPRHLKNAILRQTTRVSTPLWQRFWPRLLTGMAVPTLAVGCWLLIVATPWQQFTPDISTPQNSQTQLRHLPNQLAMVPDSIPSETPANPAHIAPKAIAHSNVAANLKATPKTSIPVAAKAASMQLTSHSRIASVNISLRSAKGTVTHYAEREVRPAKTPEVSLASYQRQFSRPVRAINTTTVATHFHVSMVKAPLRATSPDHIAVLTTQDTASTEQAADTSLAPMMDYATQHDVRPGSIRDAVDDYRAALLGDDDASSPNL